MKKYDTNKCLDTSLLGMRMKTPLISASGTFGYGGEYPSLKDFPLETLGAIVLKSVTREPRHGNPEPRYIETTGGLINSIGLQNIGIKALVNDVLPKLRKFDCNIIVSIAGSTIEEYVETAKMLSHSKDFEAVEVNISCPNVDKEGLLFSFDPASAASVTKAVKNELCSKPIIMKLSPNSPDIVGTALSCASAGADSVSLVNTFSSLAIDIIKRRPILKRNFGGLSGPAIKPIALALVAKVATAFKEHKINKPIIGLGGIQTANDVIEFLIAGATSVGIGTSIFYNPLVLEEIVEGLNAYCAEQKLSVSEIIGTLKMNKMINI